MVVFILYLAFGPPTTYFMARNLDMKKKLTSIRILNSVGMNNIENFSDSVAMNSILSK